MRKFDIFCSSPSSTAIRSGTDQRAMLRHAHDGLLRHQDGDLGRRRAQLVPNIPCSSQLPIVPKPYDLDKSSSSGRKSSASSAPKHGTTTDSRRKSSADVYDLVRRSSHRSHRPGDSTRYLLTDTTTTHEQHSVDWFPDRHNRFPVDEIPKLPPILIRRHQSAKEPRHLLFSENKDFSTRVESSSRSAHDQVVVLRVSLHCKGCEGKVRKHISKMEGVKSFTIEFHTKKVTIIGNVTASDVLASLSRVKNAQLWSSPTSSSSSSSSSSSYSLTRTPSLSYRSS